MGARVCSLRTHFEGEEASANPPRHPAGATFGVSTRYGSRLFGAIASIVSLVMIRATRQAEVDVVMLLEDSSGWLLLFVGVAFIVILGRMKFF